MRLPILVVTACMLASGGALPATHKAAPRPTADYVWDLPALYPGGRAWEADRELVQKSLSGLARWRERGIGTADGLSDTLEQLRAARGRAGKMARYALLSSEVDQSSSTARSRYDAATA